MGLILRLLAARSRGPPPSEEVQIVRRLERKDNVGRLAKLYASTIAMLMMVVGVAWILALPVEQLALEPKMDEHALQPGQASTYYDWDSVRAADKYLDKLTSWASEGASFSMIADSLQAEFATLGLQSGTQSYAFNTSLGPSEGKNVWAAFYPPRTSGTEAIVLAASWESLAFVGEFEDGVEEVNRPRRSWEGMDQQPRLKNLRGIALLLSVADFLRDKEHYAKTIIFVISDQHLEGMQAFLASYHGVQQTNMVVQNLSNLQRGVIWTALCVDYPGHSFSHLGLYFEGTNGRLPNQDLINTVSHIAQYKTSIPIRLYQQPGELQGPRTSDSAFWSRLKGLTVVQEYLRAAKDLSEHWRWSGTGRASGVHGVFLQYRIDALSVFALPAKGPHGFHSLGRLVEGSLRAMNNLLERLHASLFFYLYLRPGKYHKIGSYLPAAVLIGAGISILGLSRWTRIVQPDAEGKKGPRPVLPAVVVLALTHGISAGLLWAGTDRDWFKEILTSNSLSFAGVGSAIGGLLISLSLPRVSSSSSSPPSAPSSVRVRLSELAQTLSCLTHLLVGAMISTLSMLNFPQAVGLAAVTLPPLLVARPSSSTGQQPSSVRNLFSATTLALCSPAGVIALVSLVYGEDVARSTVRSLMGEWEVVGNWFWLEIWLGWWAIWLQTLLASPLCLG